MNQILNTKMPSKKHKNFNFFRLQFSVSIVIVVILIGSIFYSIYSLQKKEKFSNDLISSYQIYKLYATTSQNSSKEEAKHESSIFGIIEIPKINIYYPVFSYLNEELLKISPCKFYGNSPEENGNICIAGHNYNNTMFFSQLSLLEAGDEIYLYDNYETKYVYSVLKFYEVNESDLSPIFDYQPSSKELTLVTCNNLNHNRLIVKARPLEK